MTPARSGGTRLGDRPSLPVLALGLAVFAGAASMRCLDALLPAIALRFGRSVGSAGAATSGYALSYGLMQLVYGPLGDRFGAYRVVTGAVCLSAVAAGACALATSLEGLVALRFAAGAVAAAVGPLTLAHISATARAEQRSVALARVAATAILGAAAGQVGGGLLGDAFGSGAVFAGLAALFGLSGIILLVIGYRRPNLLRPPAPLAGPRRAFLSLLARPAVRAVLLAVGAECFGLYLSLTYAGALLRTRLALDPSMAGLVVSLFGVGGIACAVGAGPLLRRVEPRYRATAGGLLAGVGFVAFGLSNTVPGAGAALFAIGVGFLLLHNVLQVTAATVAPDAPAACLSLFAATATLAQAMGAAGGGVLVDRVGATAACMASALILAGFGATVAAPLTRAVARRLGIKLARAPSAPCDVRTRDR